ncbi:putative leucine-rich repeat domain superfamily, F-box-like domain superfamily [Helianthus annuus]|uniref:Leucine-rich repeat domain superfamily, F-box-like domain superfamily n=2 Tax=Helianthus annuus TaxID=4232 RepID=A0A9K3P290_HELAN|nr:putative leucine-rich repeat domain superfamily, F-box-like domain superfamily [Helianthus annuus]KAJ0611055.1 putative F-box-like domain superfamily protein [Helianthus annuus]KAJ0621966.1 putative leucine-rich repeat domain superfamily, F-box-like domain superfamily [Helianthus annuus]KAJ0626317.1 putative F-box-like domain superfamily protein [Helianthus annuus]KAJ0782662.1 putative F-box-like domain superfamily protein [Helianthus annuus]
MTIKRLRQKETETETVVDSLPESLKLHILSFLDTRHAVETSVLSKSWVSSWSCVPVLNFSSDSFQKVHPFDKYLRVKPLHRPPPSLHAFDNFVVNALSRQPVKLDRLTFKHAGSCNTEILKQVFDYALLHGVQELEASVARTIDAHKYWIWPISSSDSLTSLTLHSKYDVSCSFLGPRSSGSFKRGWRRNLLPDYLPLLCNCPFFVWNDMVLLIQESHQFTSDLGNYQRS